MNVPTLFAALEMPSNPTWTRSAARSGDLTIVKSTKTVTA